MRSGWCRLYREFDTDSLLIDKARVEDDATHTLDVYGVLRDLKIFFPMHLWYVDTAYFVIAHYHDAPEIVTGDLADDGKRDDAAKNAFERKEMRRYLAHYPKALRKKCMKVFDEMQDRRSILYAIDKLIFPLRQLYLISRSVIEPAEIGYKTQGEVNERDAYYAEKIGSNRAVDVVYAQALDQTRLVDKFVRVILVLMIKIAYAKAGLEYPKGVEIYY